MVLSANLTLRALSLGSRDDKTGWCAKEWTESTIKGILEAKGATHYAASHGLYTIKPFSLWTTVPVTEDDEIIDAFGEYYVIQTVIEVKKLDCFEGYFCGLTLRDPHYDRPATSEGTPAQITFTIIANSGANGSISPSGSVPVDQGENQLFEFTADEGYEIEDVLVDDVSQGVLNTYTFTNVQTNHTIAVSFAEIYYGEMIVNGGFESGLDNWNTVFSGTPGITDADKHSGTYSATMPTGNHVGLAEIYQVLNGGNYIPSSKLVSLSIWVKGAQSDGSQIQVRYSDSTMDYILLTYSETWTKFELTNFTPNKYAFQIVIDILGYYSPNNPICIDDVSLITSEV